jgi:cellulose synthase/poly-beta-1,6-N-acetylglucosamine synthase-like glycosyltransferase
MQWLPAILIVPYLVLLLDIYRSLHKLKPYKATSEPHVFITVVIACRNEQKHLPQLLECLADQDYPRQLYEVIVVNDNSTDKTFEISSTFNGSCTINTINNKGKGKKKAIETGINEASGNLIITTDADCSPGKNWIRTIASFYEKEKPDMIICPVRLTAGKGFFNRFQELEFLSLQGITAGAACRKNPVMCNGANLAFTREAYLKYKHELHHEIASGDDIFLLHALKRDRKSRILWLESTEATVIAESSHSIFSFLRQRGRWIAKSTSYNDPYTIILGIVTFVTILLQLTLIIAGIFNPGYLVVILAVFTLKSIPDYLILKNTAKRYGRKNLLKWFIPAQLVYLVYALLVILYSMIFRKSAIRNPQSEIGTMFSR